MKNILKLFFGGTTILIITAVLTIVIGSIESAIKGSEKEVTIAFYISNIIGIILFVLLIKRLFFKKSENKKQESINKQNRLYLVDDFELVITGIYYSSERTGTKRQILIRKLKQYDFISLEHEPNNKYDKNAIVVLNENNEDIGYVKKEEASLILKYLKGNYNIDVCVEKKYKTSDGYGIILHATIREYRKND